MSPRTGGYRHVRDLTHHQIATRVGTTAQTIEQVETGTLAPELAMVGALADAIGCAVDDLTTTRDPFDNVQYWDDWDAACAALPPLSDRAVNAIATTLDRIDTRTARRPTT